MKQTYQDEQTIPAAVDLVAEIIAGQLRSYEAANPFTDTGTIPEQPLTWRASRADQKGRTQFTVRIALHPGEGEASTVVRIDGSSTARRFNLRPYEQRVMSGAWLRDVAQSIAEPAAAEDQPAA